MTLYHYPRPQRSALNAGVLDLLLGLVDVAPEATAVDIRLVKKATYALSALIRGNPEGQWEFVEQGGPGAVTRAARGVADDERAIAKLVALVADVAVELDTEGVDGGSDGEGGRGRDGLASTWLAAWSAERDWCAVRQRMERHRKSHQGSAAGDVQDEGEQRAQALAFASCFTG